MRGVCGLLLIHAEDDRLFGLPFAERLEVGGFAAAGTAPACPEIQEDPPAAVVGEAYGGGFVDPGEGEVGCGAAGIGGGRAAGGVLAGGEVDHAVAVFRKAAAIAAEFEPPDGDANDHDEESGEAKRRRGA
jgi:hypothetical protein